MAAKLILIFVGAVLDGIRAVVAQPIIGAGAACDNDEVEAFEEGTSRASPVGLLQTTVNHSAGIVRGSGASAGNSTHGHEFVANAAAVLLERQSAVDARPLLDAEYVGLQASSDARPATAASAVQGRHLDEAATKDSEEEQQRLLEHAEVGASQVRPVGLLQTTVGHRRARAAFSLRGSSVPPANTSQARSRGDSVASAVGAGQEPEAIVGLALASIESNVSTGSSERTAGREHTEAGANREDNTVTSALRGASNHKSELQKRAGEQVSRDAKIWSAVLAAAVLLYGIVSCCAPCCVARQKPEARRLLLAGSSEPGLKCKGQPALREKLIGGSVDTLVQIRLPDDMTNGSWTVPVTGPKGAKIFVASTQESTEGRMSVLLTGPSSAGLGPEICAIDSDLRLHADSGPPIGQLRKQETPCTGSSIHQKGYSMYALSVNEDNDPPNGKTQDYASSGAESLLCRALPQEPNPKELGVTMDSMAENFVWSRLSSGTTVATAAHVKNHDGKVLELRLSATVDLSSVIIGTLGLLRFAGPASA